MGAVCLSVHVSVHLPNCPPVLLLVCPSAHLSVHLSSCLPICPSAHLSASLPVCLSVCRAPVLTPWMHWQQPLPAGAPVSYLLTDTEAKVPGPSCVPVPVAHHRLGGAVSAAQRRWLHLWPRGQRTLGAWDGAGTGGPSLCPSRPPPHPVPRPLWGACLRGGHGRAGNGPSVRASGSQSIWKPWTPGRGADRTGQQGNGTEEFQTVQRAPEQLHQYSPRGAPTRPHCSLGVTQVVRATQRVAVSVAQGGQAESPAPASLPRVPGPPTPEPRCWPPPAPGPERENEGLPRLPPRGLGPACQCPGHTEAPSGTRPGAAPPPPRPPAGKASAVARAPARPGLPAFCQGARWRMLFPGSPHSLLGQRGSEEPREVMRGGVGAGCSRRP